MSLRSEIVPEVKAAFDGELADAVQSFTGLRKISIADDWLNNVAVAADATYSGRGVFDHYTEQETDGDIVRTDDVKLLCLADEVTDKPMIDDRINGYRVVNVGYGDPANITLMVQLRKA